MLNVFKKMFGIAKKAILVFIVFASILTLFFYFINKDKITLTVDPTEQGRQQIYQIINDKQLKSSQGGQLFIAIYRLINCRFIGEACTDNPKDGDKNFDQSIFGFSSKLILVQFANPPASGIYWVSSTLQNSGFIPKSYAAEGIGFSALKPFVKIWSAFRNFTFIALVLVLVAIGFMIMFRMKINAQTVISVENALPRIIIALILITFSYPIAGFMIDLMYLFFLLVVSVLSSVGIDNYTPANTYNLLNEYIAAGPGKLWPLNFNWLNTGNYLLAILPVGAGVLKFIAGFLVSFGLSKLFWNWTKLDMTVEGFKDTAVQVLSFGFGLGDLPSWIGTAIFWALALIFSKFALPLVIGLLVAFTVLFIFIRLFFLLLTTYIQVLLLIMFSPVILLFEAIPGQKAFSWWLKNIFANLITFPFVLLIILIADIIIKINAQVGADKFWAPPFLYPLDQTAITFLFGLGLYLVLPDLIKMMKEMLGVKPLPISIGLTTFFAGATTAVGGGMGLASQYGGLALAFPGLRRAAGKLPFVGGAFRETPINTTQAQKDKEPEDSVPANPKR